MHEVIALRFHHHEGVAAHHGAFAIGIAFERL
ncbi:MAG: hypothetical protein ACI8QI_001533 [Limisphaerales bacterium]|jgi:hypothetical protein